MPGSKIYLKGARDVQDTQDTLTQARN